jgi:hypothetical protein
MHDEAKALLDQVAAHEKGEAERKQQEESEELLGQAEEHETGGEYDEAAKLYAQLGMENEFRTMKIMLARQKADATWFDMAAKIYDEIGMEDERDEMNRKQKEKKAGELAEAGVFETAITFYDEIRAELLGMAKHASEAEAGILRAEAEAFAGVRDQVKEKMKLRDAEQYEANEEYDDAAALYLDLKMRNKVREMRQKAREKRRDDESTLAIHIDTDEGIPWADNPIIHELSGEELAACEDVVSEEKPVWIVPSDETRAEPTISLNSKEYYVFDYAPGLRCRRLDRGGNVLHIRPPDSTELQLDFQIEATPEWFPEKKLRFAIQVPTNGSEEGKLVNQTFGDQPGIDLGENSYYVLTANTMAQWQDLLLFKDVRIIARDGNKITLYPVQRNGYEKLYGLTISHEMPENKPDPSPESASGTTQVLTDADVLDIELHPSNEEIIAVEEAYADATGKHAFEGESYPARHLYQFPSDLSEMSPDMLLLLIKDDNAPWIKVRGKWYAALNVPHMHARLTFLKDGMIHETGQADRLREMKKRVAGRKKVDRIRYPMPKEGSDNAAFIKELFTLADITFVIPVSSEVDEDILKPGKPTVTFGDTEYYVLLCNTDGANAVIRRTNTIDFYPDADIALDEVNAKEERKTRK